MESIDIVIKAVNQAKTTLNEVGRDLRGVGKESGKLNKDTSTKAVSGLKKWRNELDKTKKSVQSLSDASQSIVDVSKKLLMAGAAMGAAVFFPIKQAGEFESAMAKVKAIMTDISEDTFERMKEQARSLGETTRYTATQSAEAFTFLAMAGLSAQEAMEALPGTLQLAAAGGLELKEAADLATNVLAGLGFEVENLGLVNDVLARAASRSNTSVRELGEAMKIAGPAAKGSKEEFEAVVAVLGRLADAGIKGGEGGNAVKRMLILLQNPTKKAKDELDRLNVQLTDSEGKFRGLIPVLQDLGEAEMDLSASAKIFGLYTGAAAVAAAGQADKMGSLADELRNADGAAKEMAETMQDTMLGAFTRLRSAIEGFLLSVAEPLMGALKSLFSAIADIVSVITALVRATGPVGPMLVGLTFTLAVLATTIGALGLVVGGVAKGWASWTIATKMLPATLGYLSGIIPTITASMALQVGAIGKLKGAFLGLKTILLSHPLLTIGAVIVGVYAYVKQLTPEWKKLNETAETLRTEADKLKNEFEGVYNAFAKTTDKSEEQKKAAIQLKDKLIDLAKENITVSDAALKAADSIDRATGKIIDNGEAIKAFDLTVAREQLKAMAAETVAASAKMEAAMKPSTGEGLFPTNPLVAFMQGLDNLNSIFLSMLPVYDSLSQRSKKMMKDYKNALKAGKAFAENSVRELVKLGQVDPTLGLRQFETYVKSLGPMSNQMASFYYDAFLKIKIAQAEAAQSGMQLAKKSLSEQNAALQTFVAQKKASLFELQEAHKAAQKAAEIDPKNIDAITRQNEAYQQSLRAISNYVNAVKALRDNEIKMVQQSSDAKVRIIEDEVHAGLLTKKEGELEKIRIVAESAREEAEIMTASAQKVLDTVGKNAESYEKMSAAAKKAANDAYTAQVEALDKYKAKLKETYETARNEVKKYAEEVIKWETKLAALHMSTEDKIRAAKRKTMTEYAQWNDKRRQADEKLQAAKVAMENENYTLAEKLAKQAEGLYGDLATKIEEGTGKQKRMVVSIEEGTNAAIKGYGAVKNVLEDVYNTQKDVADETGTKWKAAAEDIKNTLDEIVYDRKMDINVKLEGVTAIESKITDLTRPETKVITIVTKEAKRIGGIIKGYASGGHLPGYGGGDKVNILGEAGEYMVRKEAVRKYGIGFMEAINNMRFGLSDIGSAISGRLQAIQPRLGYRTGGEISALPNMGRIELSVGNHAYPVIAQVDMIRELKTAIEKERLMRTN